MTLREVTALVLLYRACRDEALQARARELVPELGELAELTGGTSQRYVLTMWGKASDMIGTRHAVCPASEIADIADRYLKEFPGVGYAVSYDKVP